MNDKMNPQARKLWKTPAGAGLLGKMLSGQSLSPQDQRHLQKLKQADPGTLAQGPEQGSPQPITGADAPSDELAGSVDLTSQETAVSPSNSVGS